LDSLDLWRKNVNETKVALITGSSRGIGKQLALDCGRYGLSVVVNYVRSEAAAQKVVDQVTEGGGRAIAVQADASVPGDVETLIGRTLEQFGRLDCVINNAGIGDKTALEKLGAAQFDTILRVNLLSAFLVSQAAITHMKERGGRLIFMSSLAARTGGGISAAYAASKAGLEGLMHYYATYLLADRITSNAIAPALIASDMVKAMKLPSAEAFPLGRLGQPDEIWPAVRMILETEYMTGQTIHINAGRYMT
jgi:3-oxoacyl-[acyl-carrier protein] reductase